MMLRIDNLPIVAFVVNSYNILDSALGILFHASLLELKDYRGNKNGKCNDPLLPINYCVYIYTRLAVFLFKHD